VADNRTEKPTPKRRQKAREQGQAVRSRELPSALVLLSGVFLLSRLAPLWAKGWQSFFESVLAQASGNDIGLSTPLFSWTLLAVAKTTAPLLVAAGAMVLAANVGQAGFTLAPSALTPNFNRLNPGKNLGQVFSLQALSRMGKALIPAVAITYVFAAILSRDWTQIVQLSGMGTGALSWITGRLFEIGWKSGMILLAWAGLDYFLQRQAFENSLKMTKDEIKRETKEDGANPEVKGRMRRLQRKMTRKKMIAEVPKATVIITNPTHYAIALRYEPATMAAPVVIAKGLDKVAEEIKQAARWHNIPTVENIPLAHALYRSAEIGQTVPAKLYQVVAEILAFVYQMQARMAAQQRRNTQQRKEQTIQ
jgi:flagellar biosynthesis protein FlhB